MIRIRNVTKSFQGLYTPVLNDLNLSLNKGDFCVVIGANGSGKSTFFKILTGEYLPDIGSLEVNGKIAHVLQDVNIGTVPEMTLLENIALSKIKKAKLAFYSRYKKNVIKEIKCLNIGLEEYLNKPLKLLSGGQRQMIATLMAANSGYDVLLLDEHTSALDPKMQELLMEYTAKQVKEFNTTTIMITHKMDDAIKYGNRLIMLHQGKIVLDISNDEKKSLSVNDLLRLFHQYEDQILSSGGAYEH